MAEPYKVNKSEVALLDYDLVSEVGKYQAELEAHTATEGQPAPLAIDSLIEQIVRDNGGQVEIIDDTPPPLTLRQTKALLKSKVDTDAEIQRSFYITPSGTGQSMVYQVKQGEVLKWIAAGEPETVAPLDYPWASERADRHSTTIPNVLREWRGTNDSWRQGGIAIERVRETAKEQIGAAPNIAAAQAIYDAVEWPAPPATP